MRALLLLGAPFALAAIASPATRQTAETDATVMVAINRNHLTRTPLRCLLLRRSVSGAGGKSIEVMERHGAGCPGDPATQPRLFTIRIDARTGRASSDAGAIDGSFRLLR